MQRTPEAERPYSSPNSEWPILETYARGQVIDIKVIISAYHWVSGHTSMRTTTVFACRLAFRMKGVLVFQLVLV